MQEKGIAWKGSSFVEFFAYGYRAFFLQEFVTRCD